MAVGGYDSNSYQFDGQVGEVILFDKALSYKENKFLTTYLNKKYNLANSCSAPSTSERYDMTACNTTKEQLSSEECQLTCKSGFVQLGAHSPWAKCNTNGGNFTFDGCFKASEISGAQKVSSCLYAPSSGIYLIDSYRENGSLLTDVKVFCDVKDGQGSIDLLKP